MLKIRRVGDTIQRLPCSSRHLGCPFNGCAVAHTARFEPPVSNAPARGCSLRTTHVVPPYNPLRLDPNQV